MLYIIQCYAYSGILYAVYYLLLRNRAAHSWNRFYLLLCATLPLLLPFVKIPGISAEIPFNTTNFSATMAEITVFGGHTAKSTQNGILMDELFTIIYFTACIILLLYFAAQYWYLRRSISGKAYELYPGNVKVVTNCGGQPGSFGRYIFFPGSDVNPAILEHELAHISHHHSADVVYMRLLQCLFWPHAMLYVIMKELRTVHEFEADARAGTDTETYVRSLLNSVFQTNKFSLSHTFFHHPIKRRIVMLQKTPQSRNTLRTTAIRSGMAALIVIAGLIYLQSCKSKSDLDKVDPYNKEQNLSRSGAQGPGINEQMLEPPGGASAITQENGVYNYVDQMPESSVDIPTYLGEHIQYPPQARSNKIEGRVIIKFIVDEDGNVKSPTVMRTPDKVLADEAIRVISTMPKWRPGKHKGKSVPVYFTLPINFKLE